MALTGSPSVSMRSIVAGILAMATVVIASNVLVQYPVAYSVGALNLADLLTWGAFTYPAAFLVTDLTNRRFGPAAARRVVFAGFLLAVVLSILLATPRIAIASGSAFLVAQLLDVAIFDTLRRKVWWLPPFVSSFIGSVIDTVLFFSLAFAASFSMIGANDAFAIEVAPLFGLFPVVEVPRWVSWALGDFTVKIAVALALLAPYGVLIRFIRSMPTAEPTVAH